MAPSHYEGFPIPTSEETKAVRQKEWQDAFAAESSCSVDHGRHEVIPASQAPDYVENFIAREALKHLDDELKSL